MLKDKAFWIIIAAVFLNFYLSNISFAIENTDLKNIYPDYSYEFAGKDTCEKFNRKLLVFNLRLNKCLIRPVNIVWASFMPKYGMDRFQNAYNNMNFPVRLMGCLLQKDFKASKQETLRFLANTTLGVGGLYDPAQTRLKIEPRQEDIGQVLAKYKIKQGPYLVLPIVRGNVRDLVGKLLDCPFRPTSYVGPFGAAASAVFAVNNSTYMQPMVKKVDESYADPYEIAKQVDSIERYIKNSNLDRKNVFEEKTASQNIIKISDSPQNSHIKSDVESDIGSELRPEAKFNDIKPDIELTNYNPQSPLIDSMRTALFDNQKLDDSIWADVSVWNRSFNKKIKTSSVNVTSNRPNYKYRYILQKNKKAPLAILYPSIGEGIMSDKSVVLAKILYDEGYSVLIQGSAFHWEFVKSMPADYKPGFPAKDANYLRLTTAKIIDNLKSKKGCQFDKKILVGCSFGAMTGLFVAEQEDQDNTLGISNYIAINPPIELLFALRQLDKYSLDWKNNPSDIKMRTAITAEKIVQVSKKIYRKNVQDMPESMPFTDEEAKQVISFLMKQKLYDVVFAIENCSRAKQSNLYETINKMSFYNYAQKYLAVDNYQSYDELNYDTSLRSLDGFLNKSKNYKIYLTLDDYFVNKEQLVWIKKNSNNNSVFFSNGSHLGCLYRKEFMVRFKKDTTLENTSTDRGL